MGEKTGQRVTPQRLNQGITMKVTLEGHFTWLLYARFTRGLSSMPQTYTNTLSMHYACDRSSCTFSQHFYKSNYYLERMLPTIPGNIPKA